MTTATQNSTPTNAMKALRPLRVRVGAGYPTDFTILIGQSNAAFVRSPLRQPRKLFPRLAPATYAFVNAGDCDLVHTFNAVPLVTRKPFVITFEDNLPRVWENQCPTVFHEYLRSRLLGPRCLALLALSEYAVREMRRGNQGWKGLDALEKKVSVMYPSLSTRRASPKRASDRLRLLFVGREYMRKGMGTVLRAHERLTKRGVPVETVIVSSLVWSPDDYVGPRRGYDVDAEKKLLSLGGVTHHAMLPNGDVLKLMEASDYLVLPTLHDTFGYAMLESLAAGTPVIATATCAVPEIIEHDKSGFLLPIENDQVSGRWVWPKATTDAGYNDEFRATTDALAASLTDTLLHAWESRGEYERRSAGALARVGERFNREAARRRIEAIYELARR